MRVDEEETEFQAIKRGVRERCVLSQDVFIIRRISNKKHQEVRGSIGGRNINNLRYADDTVLNADTN